MLFVCVCGCDWDTDSCSPPLCTQHLAIAIDFYWYSGGGMVVVAMINQLPVAGSKPVADGE